MYYDLIKFQMKQFLKLSALYIFCISMFVKCCTAKDLPVQVDRFAYKYVQDFKNEADDLGIDTGIINNRLDDIVFYPLEPGLYGLYAPDNKQIVLNSLYYRDTITLKKVIYHELGHLYGLPHDKGGIMQTYMTQEAMHKLYCPLEGGSNLIWDMHKSYLFFLIRKNLENRK